MTDQWVTHDFPTGNPHQIADPPNAEIQNPAKARTKAGLKAKYKINRQIRTYQTPDKSATAHGYVVHSNLIVEMLHD
jgi:hypothetical protein